MLGRMRTVFVGLMFLLTATTMAHARGGGRCGDECVFFGTGVLTFALLLGTIYCGEIAVRYHLIKSRTRSGLGPRLYYAAFACVLAAILGALVYSNPSYMLGALVVGTASAAVLVWAVNKTTRKRR
jgi:peptidoglycan/LPS O-acetylase OafA/YrhL